MASVVPAGLVQGGDKKVIRISPRPRWPGSGKIRHTHQCTVDGVKYDITVWMEIIGTPSTSCRWDIWAGITIFDGTNSEQVLAELSATQVHRARTSSDPKQTVAEWVQVYLRTPADYDGELLQHSSADDEMTDLHKVLRILYSKRTGRPKPEFSERVKSALRCKCLHFIESFEVMPNFRGRGLAEHAMNAYLECLMECPSFAGSPVVLSPAPLFDQTEKMRKAGKVVRPYGEIVKRIKKTYDKSGFETVFDGPQKEENAITVMMWTSESKTA